MLHFYFPSALAFQLSGGAMAAPLAAHACVVADASLRRRDAARGRVDRPWPLEEHAQSKSKSPTVVARGDVS